MSVATKPNSIHPSAIVSPQARIGTGCFIGPFSIVGDQVELKDGVRLESHVVIDGRTVIGQDTRVFPFVSIGLPAQDLKYKGEPSETRIGRRNLIREFVTIHRGTAGGGMLTQIGDDCLLMAQAHVAHDCRLGNGVIMANAATLAGHARWPRSIYRWLFRGGEGRVAICTYGGQSCALLRFEYDGNETPRLPGGGDWLVASCISSPAIRQAEYLSSVGDNQGRTSRLSGSQLAG